LRKTKGFKQFKLAMASGLTPACLSKIESGRNNPRGGVIFRISRHLGVPVDYFLDIGWLPRGNASSTPGLRIAADGKKLWVPFRITREEKALLEALRAAPSATFKLAWSVLDLPPQVLALLYRVALARQRRGIFSFVEISRKLGMDLRQEVKTLST
jgi:transcriptional regulator with XRE-family HTH domain